MRQGNIAAHIHLVADSYRSDNESNKAIPLYAKVVATGKQPSDLIHARMGLANCYFDTSDFKNAAVQLKAVLAMDAASPAVKEQAQKMLTEVESVK